MARLWCNIGLVLLSSTVIFSKRGQPLLDISGKYGSILNNSTSGESNRTDDDEAATSLTDEDRRQMQIAGIIEEMKSNIKEQESFLNFLHPEFFRKVDGGWSDFGDWWPCTRSPGGVSYRFRQCNNPYPNRGGKQCQGETYEVRPCRSRDTDDLSEVKKIVTCAQGDAYFTRLVGGRNAKQGRVEILYNGIWGGVCDHDFGMEEARVVCASLGLSVEKPTVMKSSHFGRGAGPIWLDELKCSGNESHLCHCQSWAWGVHDCTHANEVGVICEEDIRSPRQLTGIPEIPTEIGCFPNIPIPMRLKGGSNEYQGRLEVFFDGEWGTVCDDNFGLKEARVVCRHFGLKVSNPLVVRGAGFGRGSGKIWFDELDCKGDEDNICKCKSHGWGNHDCDSGEDVGVICQDDEVTGKTKVRLVGGIGQQGRVEIFRNGVWGTICDDDFGQEEAKVICNMLGYSSEYAVAISNGFFGTGQGPIMMDNINCRGDETDIALCPNRGWYQQDCTHLEDAGVSCENGPQSYQVRLTGGPSPKEGRVEVFAYGQWSTICDDGFGFNESVVVCRMLGYNTSSPWIVRSGMYGVKKGTILIDDLRCKGTESDISQCSNSGLGVHDCYHNEDIAVSCEPKTSQARLVGGQRNSDGIVEIFLDDRWNTICNNHFTVQDATVICRMAGFTTDKPEVRNVSSNGQRESSYVLSEFQCSGWELDILQCSRRLPADFSCASDRKVAVDCAPSHAQQASRKEFFIVG